jgi:hypothetical protein
MRREKDRRRDRQRADCCPQSWICFGEVGFHLAEMDPFDELFAGYFTLSLFTSIHPDPPTLRACHYQKAFDIQCLFPSAIPWLSFEGTVVFPT